VMRFGSSPSAGLSGSSEPRQRKNQTLPKNVNAAFTQSA
jgi:hypothetical protein